MTYIRYILLLLCLTSTVFAQTAPSLRDKIGQMLLLGFDGKTVTKQSEIVKAIEESNLGGVILFDFNYHKSNFDKNIESPKQVKELNNSLQNFNYKAELKYKRPLLPLLISIDYEGGKVSRLSEAYGFPTTNTATTIGKQGLKAADSQSKAMAKTLKELGFNLDFAPVLDLDLNSLNQIIRKKERSFSNDPKKVAAYAKIYSDNFLSQNIQCAYKHFPGHGSSVGDSHLGFVDVSSSWQASELEPYKSLFATKPHCEMVMIAHIVNRNLDKTGKPASLSHKIVTELLRKSMGFDGLIITDDMQMKAISDNFGLEQAIVLSINAGSDMLIFGNNLTTKPQTAKELIDIIEAKVKAGEISKDRIDDAYKHIVKFKQTITVY